MAKPNPLDADLIDWEDELLTPLSDEVEDEPREAPAPVPKVDAAAAAAKLKRSLADAKAKDVAARSLIPAPLPSPLHEVTFPVYDRSAKGYRLITRAFGTPELKTIVKVVLDALLSGDPSAAVEPALRLDATAPTLHVADLLHPERQTTPWGCRHAKRTHSMAKVVKTSGEVNYEELARQLNYIEECVNEMHYNRSRNIESRVPGHEGEWAPGGFNRYAYESIHMSPDAWLFYEDHAPFLHWKANDSTWLPVMPQQWAPAPTTRDARLPGVWEFPPRRGRTF